MLSCNFKEKRREGDVCTLVPVETPLLFSKAYKRCDGEDNCIIFQIYDRLISLEADILMKKKEQMLGSE